ncbi:hypothetical protein CXQ81_13370 [Pseudomonas sp. 09C 129]|nr:hypothetical protein CXQ81_13370 [Pseudomonas sp. 09C 129]
MVVCSGVLFGWYGADVTWRIFFENFIGSMVTIDANDSCGKAWNRASHQVRRAGRGADREQARSHREGGILQHPCLMPCALPVGASLLAIKIPGPAVAKRQHKKARHIRPGFLSGCAPSTQRRRTNRRHSQTQIITSGKARIRNGST